MVTFCVLVTRAIQTLVGVSLKHVKKGRPLLIEEKEQKWNWWAGRIKPRRMTSFFENTVSQFHLGDSLSGKCV